MRGLWCALVVAALASGCAESGRHGPTTGSTSASAASPPAPVLLGEGDFELGLPDSGPVQTTAGLGIDVPANATHLRVELRIKAGSSTGLRAQGVPGCEHAYPDPQVMAEAPLVYECDAEPGGHTLTFSHGGGRIDFHVAVTASAPNP